MRGILDAACAAAGLGREAAHATDETPRDGLGVAGYILKPTEYEDYARVIKTIVLYWTLSETPRF